MATTVNRRLVRQTDAAVYSQGRSRPVIIEIHPTANGTGKPGAQYIGLRLARTRKTYYLPVDWIFREAVRADLARVRAERKKARAEKHASK